MNTLEQKLFERGYVRCPNDSTRWYASGPNILEVTDADVHIRYDLEHYPNGHIVVQPKPWLLGKSTWCTVLPNAIAQFDTVEEFFEWLQGNGTLSESGQGANSWD